jgi:hypothetical protein
MEEGEKASRCRCFALDIHKYYSVVAGVDREGKEILPPCRVEHIDLEDWLAKRPLCTDRVLIESTTNAWHVYDLLEPLVAKVRAADGTGGTLLSQEERAQKEVIRDLLSVINFQQRKCDYYAIARPPAATRSDIIARSILCDEAIPLQPRDCFAQSARNDTTNQNLRGCDSFCRVIL